MLHPDPNERLTLSQLKTHKWYKGPVESTKKLKEELMKRAKVNKEVEEQKKFEKVNGPR